MRLCSEFFCCLLFRRFCLFQVMVDGGCGWVGGEGRGGIMHKRCVNAGAGLGLEGEGFRCGLRCTRNVAGTGGRDDACLSFLSEEDCIVMVLQLKAAG
jgi:hypothetical protein